MQKDPDAIKPDPDLELEVATADVITPSRQVRRASARAWRAQAVTNLIGYRMRRRERRRIASKSRARNRG